MRASRRGVPDLTVEVQGIPVAYTDSGEGEVAVLLQGWGTKLAVYEGLRRALSRYMRVVMPALPGFGETPEPPEPWDAAAYAAFTRAFLRAVGVDRCVLLGHSNGGRIIMKLVAGGLGDGLEVPKCVLFDSAGIVPVPSARARRRARLYKLGRGFLSLPPVRALCPGALEALRRRHGQRRLPQRDAADARDARQARQRGFYAADAGHDAADAAHLGRE